MKTFTAPRISVALFLLAFSSSPFVAQAQKTFGLEDVGKLVGLSDPQISPDGKNIVLVVTRPDYLQNRLNAELVIVDIASGKHRILTQDRPSVTQPRWSPDGEHLAFLSKTGLAKDAVTQLFLLHMQGGEAKQLTKSSKGVQHYSWNPMGGTLAFVTADEQADKGEIEKGLDAFEVGNNDMFLSAAPTSAHIWHVSATGGEAKRLTSGTWSLPVTIPPGPPSSPLSWSPDGKTIAFVKVQTAYSGDGPWRNIQLLNVADGSFKPLTSRTKLESYPSFSPDGSQLNYWYTKQADYRLPITPIARNASSGQAAY